MASRQSDAERWSNLQLRLGRHIEHLCSVILPALRAAEKDDPRAVKILGGCELSAEDMLDALDAWRAGEPISEYAGVYTPD